MKSKEHSLLYHTMHSRPMPGCLPLFFLFALAVVGAGIWFAPVESPERVHPQGLGKVYLKKGRFADFIIQRQSPLPLHLPLHADPEFHEDIDASAMPLLRPVKVLPPPPVDIFDIAADSAVLSAETLLALPGDVAEAPAPVIEPSPLPQNQIEGVSPVFHPSVSAENAEDGEEGS